MDFPVFHLDFLGNRMLIAVIAMLHVFINHALAVGAIPLITLMEWWGRRTGDADWDRLAYRILTTCFIITTSLGALTGVGIWLSTSLVNPGAIGSLIRVFFLAWFAEWIVFCLEVGAIMLYYFTWKKMSVGRKGAHIAMGAALAALSWLTMAVIVAILGFMMEPGSWLVQRSFVAGVFNPIYLPQLAFRTPVAMLSAGLFALFLAFFFTRGATELRQRAIRFLSLWTLLWLPLAAGGALWYREVIPAWMLDNVPVALATQAFASWHRSLLWVLAAATGAILATVALGVTRPAWLPRAALPVPFVLALVLLGTFERLREFIRKPYVIGGYMYANGLRAADLPLLQEEGLLRHATYVPMRVITPANRVEAGREVFRLACTRCHTANGVNSILTKLGGLYGHRAWERDAVKAYLQTMHQARPFMPPFPGSDEEAGALADYLLELRRYPAGLGGAQSEGVRLPGDAPPSAAAPVGGGR